MLCLPLFSYCRNTSLIPPLVSLPPLKLGERNAYNHNLLPSHLAIASPRSLPSLSLLISSFSFFLLPHRWEHKVGSSTNCYTGNTWDPTLCKQPCMWQCVRACVHACVRACVRACVQQCSCSSVRVRALSVCECVRYARSTHKDPTLLSHHSLSSAPPPIPCATCVLTLTCVLHYCCCCMVLTLHQNDWME